MRRAKKYWRVVTANEENLRPGVDTSTAVTPVKTPAKEARPHNLVDALYNHFAKWHPAVLQSERSTSEN